MKNYKHIVSGLSLLALVLCSCEPRIDLDNGQWGDNAVITDVLLFTLREQEHQLQEYYENDETATGVQRQFLSTTSAIDAGAASVTVTVPANVDLTNVGLVIRHKAVKIEPQGSAPKAGFLEDFSNGPYTYRVVSADGTERDWTIIFDN